MIIETLKVMLFGMLGIFFVMGVIVIYTQILKFLRRNEQEED